MEYKQKTKKGDTAYEPSKVFKRNRSGGGHPNQRTAGTIYPFFGKELCSLNLDRLIIEAAYAAYSIHTPSERPKAMYDLLGSYCGRHVTLEMVLQSGDELPDTDAFFHQWVMYLGEKDSNRAEALL